jgi:hypothetical protein
LNALKERLGGRKWLLIDCYDLSLAVDHFVLTHS